MSRHSSMVPIVGSHIHLPGHKERVLFLPEHRESHPSALLIHTFRYGESLYFPSAVVSVETGTMEQEEVVKISSDGHK